ncbi:MAG: glycosyltransferase family 2 protein [Rugosibacter sp.]|nr:MAG: glycosyltransferase family 2 protein [Rugosibacter sp.]
MSAPLVSVIVPVRNGREFIHEALASVCSQSFSDLEIIVIDDGSDDFDYPTLTQLDPRIRVHRLEGTGVSTARNTGMKLARGQFFAFLDADDIWFPGKLAAQIRYFEQHPEAGCVFGGFTKWTRAADGAFPPAQRLMQDCHDLIACEAERSGWLYTRLLSGLLVGMNTAVIRREVFTLLGGFDASMRIGEDYLFWLKVSRIYPMHALDGPVALYRIHEASAMRQLDTENHLTQLLQIAVNRWGLTNPDGTGLPMDEFKKRLATSEFTHGYNHFWEGSPAVARRAFFRALKGGVLPLRSAAYIALTPLRQALLVLKNHQPV